MLLFVLYGLPSLLSFISACKCCYRCFVVVMLKNTIGSHTSQNIPQKEKTSYRHFLCTEGGENGVGDENRNEVGQPLIALCRNDEHQRLHVWRQNSGYDETDDVKRRFAPRYQAALHIHVIKEMPVLVLPFNTHDRPLSTDRIITGEDWATQKRISLSLAKHEHRGEAK